MINPDLNKVTKEPMSRYSLVIGVSKRARQISESKEELAFIGTEKPVTCALNELIEGKYDIIEPDKKGSED